MPFLWKTILRGSWTCCCILLTLLTMVWQCYNFYGGEENTIIEYRNFNDMETDLYPSIGLCWTLAINNEHLKQYGQRFTPSRYAYFLAGHYWDKDMLKVDYENVTSRFEDYIHRYGYMYPARAYTKSVSESIYDAETEILRNEKGYKEHSVGSYRCFSIDIPFRKDHQIYGFYLFFESNIFGEKGRLANPVVDGFEENQFRLVLHYPNQLIGKAAFGIGDWPVRGPNSSTGYLMRLTAGDIEVRVRRNSNHRPCVEGLYDYDEMMHKYVLGKVGCKPPYLNSTPAYAPCTEQKELAKAFRIYQAALERGNRGLPDTIDIPCRSLERVRYDVKDVETPDVWIKMWPWMNTSVGVNLDFADFTYKEVKSVRGMDVQALIGKLSLLTSFTCLTKAMFLIEGNQYLK